MTDGLSLTVLVENTVNVRGVRAEHGVAFLVRLGRRQLLFDTGQSDLVLENAGKMGLSLESLEAIVLSHGHYDHTGGLEAVRRVASRARVFLHPAAMAPKFTAQTDGTRPSIGMKPESVASLRATPSAVIWTTQPTEVMEGVFVTGEIPRQRGFEDTGGRFYLDEAARQPDPLLDDQALFFDTAEGWVIVLGCAHAGVVNTLDYIGQLTQGRPIHMVLGGMHLHGAGPERVERTIEAFKGCGVKRLAPAHCTGLAAVTRLWGAFGERCSLCPVGTNIVFRR